MIQLLRGTQSQLNSYSTIIPDGQPVFERDTGQLKIGTGSARYSTLPYVGSIFESSGGGGEVTFGGTDSNGYLDFPSGHRLAWGTTTVDPPSAVVTNVTNLYVTATGQSAFRGSDTNSKGTLLWAMVTLKEAIDREYVWPVGSNVRSNMVWTQWAWTSNWGGQDGGGTLTVNYLHLSR